MKPLAVVGNVNVDLILGPVAPWPRPGTEILVPHNDLRVGGAAGNVALAWSEMGIPHQIAGNTGGDHFGEWLRDKFGASAKRWPVETEQSTVSVGITHPDGERTFLTTHGHLRALDWPKVSEMIDWGALAGGYLLLCGSFITEALAADYDALFAQAQAHGIAVALDTGWPPHGWSPASRRRVTEWLGRCSSCLFNVAEAAALTGIEDPSLSVAALVDLLMPGGLAVVKCGPDGAVALDPAGKLHRAAAPTVTVIDTIGAGDIFNAAFLAATATGADTAASLAQGIATASGAISTHPRRYNIAPPLSTEITHERT